jgi:hypothetical protein
MKLRGNVVTPPQVARVRSLLSKFTNSHIETPTKLLAYLYDA